MLIAFISLMHATICMYIADTEMHMAERFLNSQTPSLVHLSLFRSAPHHLAPAISKSLQNLCVVISSDIFFLLSEIY